MHNKYILNDNYAIRSYYGINYGLVEKNSVGCRRLNEDEFAIVLNSDGNYCFTDEQIHSNAFQNLLNEGLIRIASDNDKLSKWQEFLVCNNRFWPTINLRLTERCNYNCPHCFNATECNKNNDEWSYEDFLKLLDEAQKCGFTGFMFTGGEPMLHPHFLDFVKELYKRNFYLRRLITNGKYITQEIIDEMLKIGCKPEIHISFDGIKTHDIMRGCKGAKQDTINAIELLVKNDFDVLVNTQVNKLTMDNLLETAEYLDNIGVRSIRLIKTNETPRWKKLKGDAAITTEEYYDFAVKFMQEFSKKDRNIELDVWKFGCFYCDSKVFVPDACCRKHEFILRHNVPTCSTLREEVAIGANGNLYPCHEASGLADANSTFYGNVISQGLEAAINNKTYLNDVLISFKDLKENALECKSCKYFNDCLGGCLMYRKYIENNIYGPHEYSCKYFMGNYEEKIAKALPDWRNDCLVNI